MMETQVSRVKVALGYFAVYTVWGSTYLAIRLAVESLPPFLMAGVRFLIAGGLMYIFAQVRGAPRPTAAEWHASAVVGALFFLGGNGLLCWSEQYVPSGIAALLVATSAFWMVLLDWLQRAKAHRGLAARASLPASSAESGATISASHQGLAAARRPANRVFAGLALGFIGMAILVGPERLAGAERVPLLPTAALMLGSISWSAGSIYVRTLRLAAWPMLASAMQMITGGLLLLITGTLFGEWSRLDVAAVRWQSIAAVAYLVVFGAWVGFTAYAFILRVSTPARVATYAYVNPVVAVLLGWLVAGEQIAMRTAMAAGVIVGAVALIVSGTGRK